MASMSAFEQSSGAPSSRRIVVERAAEYVRAHSDSGVSLKTLSRVVGVSERGLRNAFYGVHGVSPKRWIVAERLQLARRALLRSGPTGATVTSVATGFGFYELGRFAATYRVAFGEVPSETLRRLSGPPRPRDIRLEPER
jgi:AraC-like DNA-binding protein